MGYKELKKYRDSLELVHLRKIKDAVTEMNAKLAAVDELLKQWPEPKIKREQKSSTPSLIRTMN